MAGPAVVVWLVVVVVWLVVVVAWLAVGVAWLAVVGGRVGGIATIGLRHAGDTPWRGVYGSKIPRWRGLVAVLGPSLTPGGGRLLGLSCLLLGALVVPHVVVPQKCRMQFPRVYFKV